MSEQKSDELTPNLVVIGFDGEYVAEGMLETVLNWEEEGLLTVVDVVSASRGKGAHIHLKQGKSRAKKLAKKGTGVGFLAGLLLGGPIVGAGLGAALGAITGKMKDTGIDDKFIYEVSEGLGPDKSALFFLGRANDRDAIVEQLKLSNGRLLSTSLPPEVRKDLEKALEGR